ncbi:hypothetical protein S245_049845, partial [Arachis hypogaea]
CIESERQALLSLKRGFNVTHDDDDWLSSWGDGEQQQECCNWEGVKCSNVTGHVLMLHLHGYHTLGSISPSLSELHHLKYLDLSGNRFTHTPSLPPFIGSLTFLTHLNLSRCYFGGNIPPQLGNLSHLVYLDLSSSNLVGGFPLQLTNMSSLTYLDLSLNKFNGTLPPQLGNLLSLEHLDLHGNAFTGTIPHHFRNLSCLQFLDLSIGQLSNLFELSLANNLLHGLISEAHFSRLSNLESLDLSHNAFAFNVSVEWVPPFNLSEANLASCNLGPNFPKWLQTQMHVQQLDISQAQLSSPVPNWFWEGFFRIWSLNLSHNHIRGKIEGNHHRGNIEFQTIDLSSNLFEGPIPAFLSTASEVFLSNNRFSTANPLLCANSSKYTRFMDLSNNYLRGELPDCWMGFESLVVLDLSDNHFYGNMPKSLGSLRNIKSIHLEGNNFSGEIPSSLNNCTQLQVFDAAHNKLSGRIPTWIGDNISKLLVLSLHSNRFHGNIPFSMCNLDEIRVLDLSLNILSGSIPKCISNLSAMANQANSDDYHYEFDTSVYSRSYAVRGVSGVYNDSASLTWKGKMSKYGSTLGLLINFLDLSRNH